MGPDSMELEFILTELSTDEEAAPVDTRPGSKCPRCKKGTLDYDSMLNLSCHQCGYSLAGCST